MCLMISSKEEQIIQKLLLKGQTEAEIIQFLTDKNALDPKRAHRVRTKVYEMRAAQAFLPTRPGKIRRLMYLLWGLFITLLGGFFVVISVGGLASGDYYLRSGRFFLAGGFLLVAGIHCLWKGVTGSMNYESDRDFF